ncbi:MAG: winged helix DNA-binding protein [Devosia sp.]|nr:winged helix DNA-binding protein [Devosia sp.]
MSVLVAWVRLERATEAFNLTLKQEFGLTGLQLSILHILGERPALPLAALRKTLVMHAATLGQAVDALRLMGLCEVGRNPADRRARVVSLTEAGVALLARLPLSGPVRLRQVATDPVRLERLAAALEDALELFGLEPWAPNGKA